jgi:ribosomal protein S18 acetylase RimI-like enzyme
MRVWLEPGYDHGRCGAWLLDWPGCFTWGPDRDAALGRTPSAVQRFAAWLTDDGEKVAAPEPAEPVVVEEVAAYRLADGYEVNATFGRDAEPVTAPELEQAIRSLELARRDLLELQSRLVDFEARGGRLGVEQRSAEALASGASAGRAASEVLLHVAGAEAWFGSRLDPAARFDGPPRDGDLGPYLAGTRDWLLATLRDLQRRDPALRRTDGRGEDWTLAKLLRRAVYHSRDHWDELDRRLALAEDRAAWVELRHDAPVDPAELRALFGAVGLYRRASDSPALTEGMLAGSTETISAWDGDELVGFGRIISDEATNGYISTMAVAPAWQDRGVGSRLLAALVEGRQGLKLTLDARHGTERFYERAGFQRATQVFVRRPTPR